MRRLHHEAARAWSTGGGASRHTANTASQSRADKARAGRVGVREGGEGSEDIGQGMGGAPFRVESIDSA